MADVLTAQQRSRNMAAIRSCGNLSTEKALRFRLVRAGVKGWRLHPNDLPGKPDFAFDMAGLAVFVDGCYWHACPKCYRVPLSNIDYWSGKFSRNKARDRRVSASLRRQGWRILRIWEHEMEKSPAAALEKVRRLLGDLETIKLRT